MTDQQPQPADHGVGPRTPILHIDCATCPAPANACDDCSIGLLLRPTLAVAGAPDGPLAPETAVAEAVAAFARAGMLPRLRAVG